MKALKIKSTGNDVKILQAFLGITIDGIFGPKTEIALNGWKDSLGMNPDGLMNEIEWSILAKMLPTIKKGDKGNIVIMWQLFLGVDADGIFGAKTHSSTRAYQATKNLTIDGIVGKNTWAAAFGATSEEAPVVPATPSKNAKPVDYKQYDSRWGSVVYTYNNTYNKSQTIKNSGCGPTSMADIVATWWDKNVTPKTLAALSVANGYRTYNSGTDWGFFKFIANKYGASKFVQTSSIATLKAALQDGAYAIVSFKKSKWTNGGHFCCIWKWDGKYFYINDPASSSSNRAKGTSTEVSDARKQFFIFYK